MLRCLFLTKLSRFLSGSENMSLFFWFTWRSYFPQCVISKGVRQMVNFQVRMRTKADDFRGSTLSTTDKQTHTEKKVSSSCLSLRINWPNCMLFGKKYQRQMNTTACLLRLALFQRSTGLLLCMNAAATKSLSFSSFFFLFPPSV